MGVFCSAGVNPTDPSMAATASRVGADAACTVLSVCTKSTHEIYEKEGGKVGFSGPGSEQERWASADQAVTRPSRDT